MFFERILKLIQCHCVSVNEQIPCINQHKMFLFCHSNIINKHTRATHCLIGHSRLSCIDTKAVSALMLSPQSGHVTKSEPDPDLRHGWADLDSTASLCCPVFLRVLRVLVDGRDAVAVCSTASWGRRFVGFARCARATVASYFLIASVAQIRLVLGSHVSCSAPQPFQRT